MEILHLYYTPYIILPLLSTVVNSGLAAYAWRRRRLPVAWWFFWMALGFAGWSCSYALNTASTELWWKNLFFKFGGSFAMLSLIAVAQMVHFFIRERGLPRRLLAVLAGVPLLSLVILWTNDLHGLMRYDMHLVRRGSALLFGYRDGPYYKFHILYIYLVTGSIVLLCLKEICRKVQPRRASLLLIITAIAVPMLTDMLDISAVPEMRMATSAFFISGLCYWLAIFSNQMLHLVPIAKSALIERIKEPVLIVGAQGLLAECNKAAHVELRIPSDVAGMPFESLFHSDNPLHGLITVEDGDTVYDGRSRWWHISRTVISHHSMAIGSLFVLRDISELRRAQIELAQSLEREKIARAEQDRFLDMISHEYRTPLAIIQANIDLMESMYEQSGTDSAYGSLGKMRRSVKRLVDIFESVRRRKRSEHDVVAGEEVYFCSCIAELLAVARDFWGDRFICINDPPECAALPTDSNNMLRTVVLNLLDNAIKYSPPESPVYLEFDHSNEGVHVLVNNRSALPLHDETVPLFDKYRRGKNSSGTAGTGIGLFLAREMIEQLGGSLDLTVDGGYDVRMMMILPLTGSRGVGNDCG